MQRVVHFYTNQCAVKKATKMTKFFDKGDLGNLNEPYSSDPNDKVFFCLLVHLVKRNLALVDEGVERALVAFPLPYPLVAKEDVHLA